MATKKPAVDLLVIVGPTASGKSALALKIGRRFNGEIIAADSRTVYKGMDIGTAKPTEAQRRQVPHWGLDLVEPGQNYSAAQFKEYATAKIKEVQRRGGLPILVGGTGLYVDSVIFDFGFGKAADIRLRQDLEELSAKQLQTIIKDKGYEAPLNYQNKRHLIRTIERRGLSGARRKTLLPGVYLLGLLPPDEELKANINQRAEEMFKAGVIQETRLLLNLYGATALNATGGIIYKICLKLINKEIDINLAKDLFKKADWQYARRQKTWFRRNKFIQWFDDPQSAFESVERLLR